MILLILPYKSNIAALNLPNIIFYCFQSAITSHLIFTTILTEQQRKKHAFNGKQIKQNKPTQPLKTLNWLKFPDIIVTEVSISCLMFP